MAVSSLGWGAFKFFLDALLAAQDAKEDPTAKPTGEHLLDLQCLSSCSVDFLAEPTTVAHHESTSKSLSLSPRSKQIDPATIPNQPFIPSTSISSPKSSIPSPNINPNSQIPIYPIPLAAHCSADPDYRDEHKSLKKRKLNSSSHPTLLCASVGNPLFEMGVGRDSSANLPIHSQTHVLNSGMCWKARARAAASTPDAQEQTLSPNVGKFELSSLNEYDIVPDVSVIVIDSPQIQIFVDDSINPLWRMALSHLHRSHDDFCLELQRSGASLCNPGSSCPASFV